MVISMTTHSHAIAQHSSSEPTSSIDALSAVDPESYNGRSIPRVVGGRLTTIEDWPFIVSIRGKHPITGGPTTFCGGTAITEQWILTAAHCVVHSDYSDWPLPGKHRRSAKNEAGKWVHKLWGELSIVANTDDLASEDKSAVLEIDQIIVHEQYQPLESTMSSFNDLALIKVTNGNLKNSAILSLSPETDPVPTKSRAYVAGFGNTIASLAGFKSFRYNPSGTEGFAGSRFLQQAIVPVVSQAACEAVYDDHDPILHLCAGYSGGGEDSCQGDSGGPLVGRSNADEPFVIGVVSFGRGCGESIASGGGYGVYERVSSRISWISSHIENFEVPNIAPETTRQAVFGLANDFERQLLEIKENLNVELANLSIGGASGKVEVKSGESTKLTVSSKIEGYVLVFSPAGETETADLIYPFFETDTKIVGPYADIEIPLFAMTSEPGVPDQGSLLTFVIPADLYSRLNTNGLITIGPQNSSKTYNEFYELLGQTLAYALESSEPGVRLEEIAFATLDYSIIP